MSTISGFNDTRPKMYVDKLGYYTMLIEYVWGYQYTSSKRVRRSAIMTGFDYPMIKIVNGKPVSDNCVTCNTKIIRNRWLCEPCVKAIGTDNIVNTVNGMPEYLSDSQYEKWLKLKLLQYANEKKIQKIIQKNLK